jgi:hypothetical protein
VENAPSEVAMAKEAFDLQLERPVEFYIFPFDFWTPETLAAVEAAGHIGARAGNRDDNDGFENPPINPPEPGNDLEVEFDVWPRSYSKYASWFPEDILTRHVWYAIDSGGWAVREFHSVSEEEEPPQDGSQGFGPVPLSVYEDHLDFLNEAWATGYVWTAPPSTVIRYRHARTACKASVSGSTIEYDTSDPECSQFATPISVIVETANDVPGLEAIQDGAVVPTRKLGSGLFSVTADPTIGPVELAGCAIDSFGIADGEPPPPNPPANSVCDIQTVTGTGSPGLMDDLERDAASLQLFPNPAQGDGRDGSWSWYPGNVEVTIVDDGGNRVLRYSGDNLMAWTGVTLAFLGGNGAGSCYDASEYTGLRFRIRGSVMSGDELNGRIILSLVTAETQTVTFGGDLDGMGGHFHSQVMISDTWQTVELPWSSFMPPTWGDSMSLTELAVGKLQAIDWGVTNMASSFQVELDDIELY